MQRLLLRASRLRRATDVSLQQATSACASSSACSTSAWHNQQPVTSSRWYSTAEGGGEQQKDVDTTGNDKVRKLAEEVMGLTVLECSWLSEILRKKLNIQKPAFGAMPMMPAMGVGAPAAAASAEAPPAEVKKEKTEFTVKLDGFSPDGKIKVIKEIRAITQLGLKEAKELVDKAPVVVKAGLSKADAEAMQKQLEGVGGKVILE